VKLVLTADARRHLDAIFAYVAANNPAAAKRVLASVRRAFALLREAPRIGYAGRVTGTREWPVRRLPYVIVYQVDEVGGELMIIAIYHGARQRPPI
jgi:addiction module RelE/StbE family toxin